MNYSLLENPNSIKQLQDLLCPKKESDDSSSDDDDAQNPMRKLGPGDIGPQNKNVYNKKPTDDVLKVKEKEEDTLKPLPIDEKDDIEKWMDKQEQEDDELLETRKRPEYKITYKQAIGTEDIYLQMSNRNCASMSCEDMIIEIELPDETVDSEQMNLSVTENLIDLKSPIYRLKLPLTQPIDPDKGTAKFDNDRKVLILTLRMKRELDFINF